MSTIIDNFIKFIFSVSKKPSLFGINKIEDVKFIMLGYTTSANNTMQDSIIDRFLVDFTTYVKESFNERNNFNWDRIIRFYSASDSHSLELFNEIFHEFVNSQYYTQN